jgi:hypothetical protein
MSVRIRWRRSGETRSSSSSTIFASITLSLQKLSAYAVDPRGSEGSNADSPKHSPLPRVARTTRLSSHFAEISTFPSAMT